MTVTTCVVNLDKVSVSYLIPLTLTPKLKYLQMHDNLKLDVITLYAIRLSFRKFIELIHAIYTVTQ